MEVAQNERIALLTHAGSDYSLEGETLIAYMKDPMIERASLVYWRYRLSIEPNVHIPDVVLSNKLTLYEALHKRFPDVEGARERRIIILRGQHFAESWPEVHTHFNWLRIGIMVGCTYDLEHVTRDDVLPLLHSIHVWEDAYKVRETFREIKRLASHGGRALHSSRAQSLGHNQFWDLSVFLCQHTAHCTHA